MNTSAPADAISNGGLHFHSLTLDAQNQNAPLFVFLLDAAPLTQGITFQSNITFVHGASVQQLFFLVTNNGHGVQIGLSPVAAFDAFGTWLVQGSDKLFVSGATAGGTAVGRLLTDSTAEVFMGTNQAIMLSTP